MPEKILIIDDDPITFDIITHTTRHTTLDIEFHALENLDLDSDIEPILVVTDLNMHVYRGKDTLRKVEERFPGVPYIVMSGVEPMDLLEMKEEFGFSVFLNKDDLMTDIERVIRDALHE